MPCEPPISVPRPVIFSSLSSTESNFWTLVVAADTALSKPPISPAVVLVP